MSVSSVSTIWAQFVASTSKSTTTDAQPDSDDKTSSTLNNTAPDLTSKTNSVALSGLPNLHDVIRELDADESDTRHRAETEMFVTLLKPLKDRDDELPTDSLEMMADTGIRNACKTMIKAHPDVFDYELRKIGLTTLSFKSIVRLLILLHERTDDIELLHGQAVHAYYDLFTHCNSIILRVCSDMFSAYLPSTDALDKPKAVDKPNAHDEPNALSESDALDGSDAVDKPDTDESDTLDKYHALDKYQSNIYFRQLQTISQSHIIPFLFNLVDENATTDVTDATKGAFKAVEFAKNDTFARYSVASSFYPTVCKELLRLKDDGGPELLGNFKALVRDVNENWDNVDKPDQTEALKRTLEEGKAHKEVSQNTKHALIEFIFKCAYFFADVQSTRAQSDDTGSLTAMQKETFKGLPESLEEIKKIWDTLKQNTRKAPTNQ